jgi:hypothetical protein
MDLAHDLASFVLFFLVICAVVLAVVGVLYFVWRGLLLPALSYLVRKGILQPVVGPASATRERSVSGLSRHFIEIGILSVVLALAALSITKMNTPGMWVTAWFCARANRQGSPYDLRTILTLPIVLDASMIFVVLWGAYSMWTEKRGQDN